MAAENIDVKLISGNYEVDNRKPSNLRILTLEKLFAFIDGKVKDEKLAEIVKNAAKQYPQQALSNFKKNIQSHIAQSQKKLNNKAFEGEIGE